MHDDLLEANDTFDEIFVENIVVDIWFDPGIDEWTISKLACEKTGYKCITLNMAGK